MAISGKEPIQIGLQNESVGSDSLYTAFNKTANNFTTLFANASPYNTFSGNGVSVATNPSTGTVDITNTGVINIVAGTNISINRSNGNVTIAAAGGNGTGGGTVTSVGISSGSLVVGTDAGANSAIVSSGTLFVNLSGSGVVPGTYTYPTVSIDQYGRVTSASNAASVGTVTSVGINPGTGIQVTNSPITSSGEITVINTGVTRLSAGQGISVSSSNGNVTISSTTTSGGTVTSVGLTSSTLSVTGSPITAAGSFTVNLPTNTTVTGNVVAGNVVTGGLISATGNITSSGKIASANATSGIGYATGAGSTITQTGSRTSGVTINTVSGAITLVSAAGSATVQSFTVTNSAVVATDVIIVNQKSGTDLYRIDVTNVGASSFQISFATTGGTTTEQPVFNFAVIKGVAA